MPPPPSRWTYVDYTVTRGPPARKRTGNRQAVHPWCARANCRSHAGVLPGRPPFRADSLAALLDPSHPPGNLAVSCSDARDPGTSDHDKDRGGGMRGRGLILVTLCLAALIINLDTTIVNVALPALVRETGATTTDL